MFKLTLLLPISGLLATTAGAIEFKWTRCTNAPHCISTTPPGDPSTHFTTLNEILYWPGGYLRTSKSDTRFSYSQEDGYWYSHDADGIYVSPAGYVHFAHGYNVLGVESKDGDIGVTTWKNFGAPCCLPDSVGTNIYDLIAYQKD